MDYASTCLTSGGRRAADIALGADGRRLKRDAPRRNPALEASDGQLTSIVQSPNHRQPFLTVGNSRERSCTRLLNFPSRSQSGANSDNPGDGLVGFNRARVAQTGWAGAAQRPPPPLLIARACL